MAESHKDEYDVQMDILELIWGEGFMAPGGEGNVHRIVDGLDLSGRTVLEIGSGLGGGALVLAQQYGARVIGMDVEEGLVERARRYAAKKGVLDQVEFRLVKPGPFAVDDASVDVVYASGVLIHLEDKPETLTEVYRVLKPGGILAGYDWLKSPGPLSDDMLEWIRIEGLTFYMDTLENYAVMVADAGFERIETTDASDWYRREGAEEYARMRGPLYEDMTRILGPEQRDHFLEDWRQGQVVLDKGELRSGYFRGYKPATAS
jgi:phosphoethanolamine N-methyltransferase